MKLRHFAALFVVAALAVAFSMRATTTAHVGHYAAPLQSVGLEPARGFPGYSEPAGTEGWVEQSLCVSLSPQSNAPCVSLTATKVVVAVTFGAPAAVAHTSCGRSPLVTGAAEVRIIDPDQQVFARRVVALRPGVNRDTFEATVPPGAWYYVVSVRRVTRQVSVPWPIQGRCLPQQVVLSAPALLGSVSVETSSLSYRVPR
jgi:hypothetical protein